MICPAEGLCCRHFPPPVRTAMIAQCILVPQLSSVPAHEAKARQLLNWLVKREIVEALPSTCGI